MTYTYKYRNDARDLWLLSMQYVYTSMIGFCNIVFTVAVIATTIKLWPMTTINVKAIMLLICCLFLVMQPLAVWSKSKKRASKINDYTEVTFDRYGVHITVADKHQTVPWKKMVKVTKRLGMIIAYSDSVHGYVLPNRVLGSEKKEFYDYAKTMIKNNK